ncbi:MAG: response regulator [Kouleothrix sp.]|nr:response regulator [Kouleothrix sp.]
MTDVLIGGDELGALMRSLDWARTPLGAPKTWPQSLSSAVSICLNSRFPIAIYWGPQLALLYNDAWSPILGAKHPWALGRPGHTVWPEIWAEIGPLFDAVHRTGEGVWQQDRLLPMHRHGYTEECYFNFTFSPIRGEDGGVAGIFNAVIETTFRVIEERRARILRDLSERTAGAKSPLEACASAAAVLGASAADVPFCLFYLREQGDSPLRLAAAAGAALPALLRPPAIDPADPASRWPVRLAWRLSRPVAVDHLGERFGLAPASGVWPEAVEHALVVPIPGMQATEPAGLLIAGVSPRRALDAAYHTFIERIAQQVATAIGNAHAYEVERRRAEALAELDRAKTAFFSNVSHEFRTPLTLMLGPLEDTLSQPGGPTAADRERLGVAHRNAVRLLKLVNTLLDFSRIEAGRVQASYEPTDLAAFTAELASVFRSAVERAGLRLIVNCPPLPALVYVDCEMWEKIVFNLLSNAFKFTFVGEIEVALRQSGARVELVVRDTGTGIPAEEIPHLFERFHRVKGARGRTFEGSGIGLALVQELAKLHGGEVHAASAVDQGATFTISIPTGTAHLPADRIAAPRMPDSAGVRDEAYVQEALQWLPSEGSEFSVLSSELTSHTETQSLELRTQNSARILLADDNADMREYVRRLLGQAYAVVAANDGAAALRAAREQPFDLVLSDVMMPGLDGFGLLRELRADERTREVPVILLSARAGEEARIEGVATGADDYLVKPFSARELLARVRAHLDMARVRREAARRERELRAEAQTARAQLESVLAGINDQFLVLDHDWRYVFVNDHMASVMGLGKEELLGKRIWEVFPDMVGTAFEREVRRAAAEQAPGRFEYFYPRVDRWFESRVYPAAAGLTLFVADITERKAAERALAERERLLDILLKVSDASRELHDEVDIARAACRLVKDETGAVSCSCGFVYPEEDRVLIVADARDDGVPSIEGEWPLSGFGPDLIALHAQGSPVVIEDTATHPATAAFQQTAFDAMQTRSLVGIPLVRDGRFVAYFSIHDRVPRRYTAAEVSLLRDVAVRVWEAIQRSRAEAALRANQARQALLLRLLQGQRETSDPDVMLAAAAEAVGRYLGANRLGFFDMLDDDTLHFTVSWTDGALAPLSGTFPATGIGTGYLAEVRAGRTLGIADTASDPLTADSLFGTIGARSIIGVPIIRGGRWHAGFYINHAVARHWTDAEIALVRDVGEQTWDAVERARAEAGLREAQARRLAEKQQHAARLQQLNAASLAINAAPTRDDLLRRITDEARALIGTNDAVVTLIADRGWAQAQTVASLAAPDAWPTDTHQPGDERIARLVYDQRRMIRLSRHELAAPAAQRSVGSANDGHPPRNGVLAAPLIDSDGAIVAVIQLSDKAAGEFSGADEALLQQLAQIAAVALENRTLYEHERAARAQAEEASRLKDDFLATVSHELRTPLTALLGYAQLLQSRKRDEAYVARTVEKIVHSARAQAQITEDLLDVARIVTGKLRIAPEPIDLIAAIHAALDTVRPAVEAKGLRLQVDLSPSASTIIGDANRLQQVVWNLLVNATKFTPHDGAIQVRLAPDGREARLTVSDTGQGISPAFLPFVFDRFRQADSTSNRAYGGLGLGLSIVRHLVELHGGAVQVASAGLGQGATFTVRLPLASVGHGAGRASGEAGERDAAGPWPPELRGMRVLVVDDQPDILELLYEILAPCGAVVRTCSTAREALETLRAWQPDVLVSDIAMPGEDGYWLIHHVRALAPEEGGGIPAVALTAYVRVEDRIRVLAAGFQQYVPKPLEPAEFRAVIARLPETAASE